ncbi:unnamed protein product, partial [Medioppia subpectinata]
MFKTCWDWLILIATFYVAIIVPYSAAFRHRHADEVPDRKTIITDIGVEIVFIFDIIMNFRTTFVNKKGEVVAKSKSIAKHYMRGWFGITPLIHLLKLTRLLRLARLLQKMDRYSQFKFQRREEYLYVN